MKSLSPNLAAHLLQDVTTLATCWKLTRRDGVVMGFTDYAADVLFEGQNYVAATGFTPSAHVTSANLAVNNQEVEGVLDAGFITEADITAGKYDFAQIEVFQVNALSLGDGRMILRTGTLGEISLSGGRFTAEVRGLAQPLAQTIGQLYSSGCRAKFGDSRCKQPLASFTFTASVTSVTSSQTFVASGLAQASGTFDFGTLTFTSGANQGLKTEVKVFLSGGSITLVLPMPYAIAVADNFTISAGCDKSFETCTSRFNNAINFRGEPHVPGLDRMLETSATRSEW